MAALPPPPAPPPQRPPRGPPAATSPRSAPTRGQRCESLCKKVQENLDLTGQLGCGLSWQPDHCEPAMSKDMDCQHRGWVSSRRMILSLLDWWLKQSCSRQLRTLAAWALARSGRAPDGGARAGGGATVRGMLHGGLAATTSSVRRRAACVWAHRHGGAPTSPPRRAHSRKA